MQSVTVPEEEKSDEIVTKDDIVHEHKNEEKEMEQNSDLSEDNLETVDTANAEEDEDTALANEDETFNTDAKTGGNSEMKDIETEDRNEESNTENEDVMCESGSESLESKSDDAGSES